MSVNMNDHNYKQPTKKHRISVPFCTTPYKNAAHMLLASSGQILVCCIQVTHIHIQADVCCTYLVHARPICAFLLTCCMHVLICSTYVQPAGVQY